jgi:2-C-methyl-D-erythritol 4-phosphate cytidylyltransferase/2-C-methyl-D-erythritol 2,4-cyclodiphosphate synthase
MKKSQSKIYAIVLAGGSGNRMGTEIPKVLLPLNGMPALIHSLKIFNSSNEIDGIVLVCPEDKKNQYAALAAEYKIDKLTEIAHGGTERTDSVYNGLCSVNDCSYILIHDGARPMLREKYIDALLKKCKTKKSAIAANPVVNTIKKVDDDQITGTVDRTNLWEVYTPQCFEYDFIKKAYDYVIKNSITITDDASALEAIGEKVYVVDIKNRDFKLTTPSDIKLVEKLIMENNEMRVGLGFDVHRFAQNRRMVLGGVEIPYKLGLLGHSDADVLTHAIMDAVLGAAGLPDIGQLFPDSSEEFKDIYSVTLLKKVMVKVIDCGFRVNNIDAVIACEAPKIAPYREKMIKCLSGALLCSEDRINIKGTTTEQLGFEGRGEGISTRCIASLIKTKA